MLNRIHFPNQTSSDSWAAWLDESDLASYSWYSVSFFHWSFLYLRLRRRRPEGWLLRSQARRDRS